MMKVGAKNLAASVAERSHTRRVRAQYQVVKAGRMGSQISNRSLQYDREELGLKSTVVNV